MGQSACYDSKQPGTAIPIVGVSMTLMVSIGHTSAQHNTTFCSAGISSSLAACESQRVKQALLKQSLQTL